MSLSLLARDLILKEGQVWHGVKRSNNMGKSTGSTNMAGARTVRTAWLEQRISIRSPEVRYEGKGTLCIWEIVQNHIEVFKCNSV